MKGFERRALRPAWTIPALVALVAIGVQVHQYRMLEALAGTVQLRPEVSAVRALEERLTALEQFRGQEQVRPPAASHSDLLVLQAEVSDRLSGLESGLNDRALVQDLLPLQTALASAQAAISRLESRPAPKRPAKPNVPPAVPFSVLGVELRGGQRFLAISPLEENTLEQIQLLRAGDQHLGWTLEAFEAQGVIFRVDGQTRRLAVP